MTRKALKTGQKALPDYSHPNSPRKFTQPQLLAVLALRQFFDTDRLLDAFLVEARKQGLIGEKSELAAIDSTGLEAHHRSTYFGSRCGQRQRRFPRVSIVIDVSSHLCLAAVVERGSKPDDLAFDRLVRASYHRQPFEVLPADAGYDGENHHRFLHDNFGVIGIIPPIRGRLAHDLNHRPPTLFRRLMADHRDDLEEVVYGLRWQMETAFSMIKRNPGSALTARRRHSLDREIHLRLITHNVLIIRCPPHTSQQSRTFLFFAKPTFKRLKTAFLRKRGMSPFSGLMQKEPHRGTGPAVWNIVELST